MGKVWVRCGEGEASDDEARQGQGTGRRAPEMVVGCAELVSTVVSSRRVAVRGVAWTSGCARGEKRSSRSIE